MEQKKNTMKPKEIQDLIDYISNTGLAEVKIKTEEFELSVKKYADAATVAPAPQVIAAAPAPAPAPVASAPVAAAPSPAPSSNLVEIKSPMIGTFYLTASPDAAPFVTEGGSISAGKTVCIIEAMKLFNEIESEISGKIVKILVANASPVEYDQPLFLVDPAG
jgi:acetyl-CoA carboxylase biotin carboxyl carrier protein